MESMEVTVTLQPDVVQRLLDEPLWRGPRTPEEHEAAYAGGPTTYPVTLEEILNEAIRQYPLYADAADAARKAFIKSGALLGDPDYAELWEEEK